MKTLKRALAAGGSRPEAIINISGQTMITILSRLRGHGVI